MCFCKDLDTSHKGYTFSQTHTLSSSLVTHTSSRERALRREIDKDDEDRNEEKKSIVEGQGGGRRLGVCVCVCVCVCFSYLREKKEREKYREKEREKRMRKGMMMVMVLLAVLMNAQNGMGSAPAPEVQVPADSIAGVALSEPELSVLVDALTAADFVRFLTNPLASFTVFAPTNDAFANLLDELSLEDISELPVDVLINTLLYHVVPASYYATDFTQQEALPTLEGAQLFVNITSTGGVNIQGVGSDADVIQADVEAGSSVIHVVDEVLLPFRKNVLNAPSDSVVSVAFEEEELSTLIAALTVVDYLGLFTDPNSEFTVFAPTNTAFANLLQTLGVDSLADVPIDVLANVLLYHVVPSVAKAGDLTEGMALPTVEGADLSVSAVSPDGVVIEGITGDAAVLQADIEAGASVIHVIDGVLLPFELSDIIANAPEAESVRATPIPTDSIAGVAITENDLSTLVSGVVSTGLSGFLSNPGLELTVFAPTNEAFAELLGQVNPPDVDGDGLDLDDVPDNILLDILLYHVVPSAVSSSEFMDNMRLQTLEGGTVSIDMTGEGVVIEGIGTDASVVQADVAAGKAFVHVIDKVLLPFPFE